MPAGFAQVLVFTQSISSENRGNKRRRGKQWAGMVLVFTQYTLFQRDRKPRFLWSMVHGKTPFPPQNNPIFPEHQALDPPDIPAAPLPLLWLGVDIGVGLCLSSYMLAVIPALIPVVAMLSGR